MHIPYRVVMMVVVCICALLAGWGIATVTSSGREPAIGFQPPPTAQAQLIATALSPSAPTAPTTASQQAQAPVEPTLAALPEPTVVAAAPTITAAAPTSQISLREEVAAIMAPLQTGQLTAEMAYGDGTIARANAVFDLGTADRAPSVLFNTTYKNQSGTQSSERILIGERSWQRTIDQQWTLEAGPSHILHEVQALLPNPATVGADEARGDASFLKWYDAGQDVDVTLRIDPDSKLPSEMRQMFRTTGFVRTITYKGWNEPVRVDPPTSE